MYLSTDTKNSKIVGDPRRGYAAALTLPIRKTCDPKCPFLDEGCYAQGGPLAIHVARLERLSEKKNALAIAKDAAAEIRDAAVQGLARGRALRLFQAGDARTAPMARALSMAGRTWMSHGGLSVWGYTHAWRDVPKNAWSGVSMLASIEDPKDGKKALKAGYAPALVVDHLPEDGKAFESKGVTYVPCPEQTRGVPCIDCKLCWNADGLAERKHGIAFGVHGIRVNNLKRKLPLLQPGR